MTRLLKVNTAYYDAGGGLLRIRRRRIYEDGTVLDDHFICQASAAPWLADQIVAAATSWVYPDVGLAIPPDYFTVSITGGQGVNVQDTYVHVRNDRDPAAPFGGKTYSLGDITTDEAQIMAAQLRTFRPASTPGDGPEA